MRAWPLAAAVALICVAALAPAQETASEKKSINLTGVTFEQAVDQVGRLYGRRINLQTAKPIQGRFRLSLSSATVDEALDRVVQLAAPEHRLRWRRDRDVIIILPIDELPGTADVPEAFRKRVDMIARDRPIGEVIRALARAANVNIRIDREIPGDLTLDVMARDEPLWTVLQRIAIASHLRVDAVAPREALFRPLSSFAAYYRGRKIGGVREEYGLCRSCRFDELKRNWRFCPMCGERIR